jgi:hypothetical protein
MAEVKKTKMLKTKTKLVIDTIAQIKHIIQKQVILCFMINLYQKI